MESERENKLISNRFYQRELKMIGKSLPVLVSETGWDMLNDENDKATWQVEAYKSIFILFY